MQSHQVLGPSASASLPDGFEIVSKITNVEIRWKVVQTRNSLQGYFR